MHRQLDLLAPKRIGLDASFAELRRAELAGGAWVDHVPGWFTGHDLRARKRRPLILRGARQVR
jgi:hypothetical protein